LLYAELRRLAADKLARAKLRQALDATGLVHEAYLRVFRMQDDGEKQHWNNRSLFSLLQPKLCGEFSSKTRAARNASSMAAAGSESICWTRRSQVVDRHSCSFRRSLCH